ncbi:MAG: sn-glycerol-3-phosphate ABC transporter ATP-binding protein UgpC [Candidatus Edwardsbacteria bacterium]|nr:sn-glycerol-3-phosphate ABC transporter ATP-binding protein UgpC [Candidatus Edwardsbacteria bacterium]MBU1577137.1 sn-glycerol-3-phosphate ABC transporter ATP-binding protein UgpC [Candidatus Edwardsbacteria bacterium]MBU2463785.1 sn-glycerol-3-phosphate ABC transporter ATP-binding protein UgpC [Candidatus Edwardsbacteria bacterium]MBU2593767.1 sn-glycerol-3-phosphate ABC transporter ATP-binding protein UgpC [Candidatus Edwardsbacteria bacterium]
MAEVLLENLTKVYDKKVTAVSRVNLKIKNGEFLVLVGPSGCGKTTILRMIAGLEEITEGSVYIDNNIVNDVAPKDRNVAMVFQNYALYPHMTVFDNIAFGLKMAKMDKALIKERVARTAEMLDMQKYLDRKPKALSGGQRQRVALARAIVKSPKVFLFDEPLSNLDAQLRTQTRAELKRLQQQLNTTAIYVTHDRTEAMTLGDRIAVIKDGLLHQVGEPLAIYNDPANLFVANFIGTPGINLIPGSLISKAGKFTFKNKQMEKELPHISAGAENGTPVLLGIRPENISLAGEGQGLRTTVDLVEQLGGESLIYTKAEDGSKVIARTFGNIKLEQNSFINLDFKPSEAHLFRESDGQRIR